MAVRLGDLDPAARKRLTGKVGAETPTRGKKRQPARDKDEPVHLRCHTCGLVFRHTTGKQGWEPHSDETGHRRFYVILTMKEQNPP